MKIKRLNATDGTVVVEVEHRLTVAQVADYYGKKKPGRSIGDATFADESEARRAADDILDAFTEESGFLDILYRK